jgi:hypothetical protein
MNIFKLTEILKSNKTNHMNFSLFYSDRTREKLNQGVKVRALKLEYLFRSKVSEFKVSPWFEYKEIDDKLYSSSRCTEISTEVGLKLNKVFSRFFSTSFEYSVNDLDSKSSTFDSRSFTSSLSLIAVY